MHMAPCHTLKITFIVLSYSCCFERWEVLYIDKKRKIFVLILLHRRKQKIAEQKKIWFSRQIFGWIQIFI